MMINYRALLFGSAMVLGVAGCSSPPAVGNLSGDLTLNGAPVKLALVTAYNEKDEPVASITARDGKYELVDVPVGDVFITVITHTIDGLQFNSTRPPPVPGSPALKVKSEGDEEAEIDPVPLKYTSPKKSELKAKVVLGVTTPFNIEMTGKGEIPRAPAPPVQGGVPGGAKIVIPPPPPR